MVQEGELNQLSALSNSSHLLLFPLVHLCQSQASLAEERRQIKIVGRFILSSLLVVLCRRAHEVLVQR